MVEGSGHLDPAVCLDNASLLHRLRAPNVPTLRMMLKKPLIQNQGHQALHGHQAACGNQSCCVRLKNQAVLFFFSQSCSHKFCFLPFAVRARPNNLSVPESTYRCGVVERGLSKETVLRLAI